VNSHIGYGAPHKQDTSGAHGEPLGEEEVRLAKRTYGWPEDKKFYVPDGVYDHFREGIGKRGKELRDAWFELIAAYRSQYPELADELLRMQHRQLPEGWDRDLPEFPPDSKGIATRESSAKVLNAAAKNIPWLIGGAADLAPSTKTRITFEGAGDFSAENYTGRNFHFGIREHAMGAILNGMSLVKVRPFGSGFFIFVDYMRGSLRLSALMQIPVIYIFTHDSIGVGEDGPTHQPVEQLAHMRSTPGLIVIRPCDANEVREAWKVILQLHHEPAVLVLTRQAVPTIDRSRYAVAAGLARGAYVLADAPNSDPEVILIGTGSEVALCLEAYEQLTREGARARGQHAVMGTLRRSGSRLQGISVASACESARFRGRGFGVRLDQVYGNRRAEPWNRDLRGLSAYQAIDEKIWFHRGAHRSRGEQSDCPAQITGLRSGYENRYWRRSRRF
jgi:transketolase